MIEETVNVAIYRLILEATLFISIYQLVFEKGLIFHPVKFASGSFVWNNVEVLL